MQNSIIVEPLRTPLKEAILQQGLSLDEPTQHKLLQYLELLHKWNQIHNLTAVRDPKDMIYRHVIDSLTLYPWIIKDQNLSRIVDIGTGAGLPGLILAICLPNVSFVLIDSQQKKINFVQHVILSLGLKNASSLCLRVEDYHPNEGFDWVVSRAFASLGTFVKSAGHLCRVGGRLVAMKGRLSEEEKAEIPPGFVIERCEPVKEPRVGQDHCLIFIEADNSTRLGVNH